MSELRKTRNQLLSDLNQKFDKQHARANELLSNIKRCRSALEAQLDWIRKAEPDHISVLSSELQGFHDDQSRGARYKAFRTTRSRWLRIERVVSRDRVQCPLSKNSMTNQSNTGLSNSPLCSRDFGIQSILLSKCSWPPPTSSMKLRKSCRAAGLPSSTFTTFAKDIGK
jgi:hypothetical protein